MDAARLMARGELRGREEVEADAADVDEALAAFGLVAEEPVIVESGVFYLWPECLDALNLFNAVQTQWKVGPMGPVGLDYPGVRASPAFNRLPPDRREEVFEEVCVMECAYLGVLAERAAERAARG